MIITISGFPGSGKSTNAKMLADALGYQFFSMGNMRREMARQRGLTLEEYNKLGERDFSTDREVDEYQRKLGETQDNFVVDGRTSYYFIPKSFKIFLDCDIQVAAQRIWGQIEKDPAKRNESVQIHSVDDMVTAIERRVASDRKRYHEYYQIDVYDHSQYDVVLDTSQLTAAQVHEQLLPLIEAYVGRSKA